MNSDNCGSQHVAEPVGEVVSLKKLVQLVPLQTGFGLLPITLSVAQVVSWTGLKKTKVQGLINDGHILTAKVDGRTLVLTASVIDHIQRNLVTKRG